MSSAEVRSGAGPDRPAAPAKADAALDSLARLLAAACRLPIALVVLREGGASVVVGSHGLPAALRGARIGRWADCALGPGVVEIEEARHDPALRADAAFFDRLGVRSAIGAAIFLPTDEPVGSVWALDRMPRALADDAREHVLAAARQAEAVIERRRAAADTGGTRRSLRLQEALLRLRDRPLADIAATIANLTEECSAALGVDRAGVWMFRDGGEAIVCEDLYARGSDTHTRGERIERALHPRFFEAIGRAASIIAEDGASHPATAELADGYLDRARVSSLLYVPVRRGAQPVGILACEHVGPARRWTSEEERFAIAAASFLSVAVEAAERSEIQRALEENDARLRSLANNLPNMALYQLTYDLEGRSTLGYVNEAMEQITGLSAAMLAADPAAFRRQWHEEDRERVGRVLAEATVTLRPVKEEFRIRRPSGEQRWVSVRATPRHLASGFTEWNGFVIDITERKRTAEALARTNHLLVGIGRVQAEFIGVEGAPAAFDNLLALALDLTASRYGCLAESGDEPGGPAVRPLAVAGASGAGEVLAPEIAALLLPGGAGSLSAVAGEAAAIGAGLPGAPALATVLAVPIRRADTVVGLLALGGRAEGYGPDQIAELSPILSTSAAMIDAARTDRGRREAERQLRQLNATLEQHVHARTAALRESEEQLRLIADNLPVFIAYVDAQRRYRFVNRTAEQWYARSAAEVLGRALSEILVPEHYAVAQAFVTRVFAGETIHIENQFPYPDGKRRWVEQTYVPDFGPDGRPRGYFVLVIDATERKNVEQQLLQAQKMEAIGQLTGGIAHDFNNLLGVIVGNLDLLAGTLPASSPEREMVGRAMNAARRGASLTQQLLAFARRQALQPRSVDANHLVSDMTSLLRRTLGETIRVETRLADGLWPCRADPGQLESALLNLALNARDALREGGSVVISTANAALDGTDPQAPAGDYVAVAVADTGSGMSAEVRERAFEPFFTTKEVGKGTGLGLSMVYGFARQSGGTVAIDSEPGRGTVVTIYLPRAIESAPAEQAGRSALPRGDGRKVVVVEDNPDMREFSAMAIESLGFRALAAADGREALALLDANPDAAILFSDVLLPGGMDGYELAQEALRRRRGLKVLFTTGFADPTKLPAGMAGADAMPLAKPFRLEELGRRIDALLRGPD